MGHREPYCVVIGGINLDIQGFSSARYVAGDSNPGTVKRAIGGVGRNIAENLVRLGLRTELITALGEGEEWGALIQSTAELGIGLDYSPRFRNLDIPTYLCILEPDGNLAGAVADMGAIDALRVEHLESCRGLLNAASAIVVDGNISSECIAWIVANYGTRSREAKHGSKPGLDAESTLRVTRPLLVADPVSGAKAHKFISCLGQFDIAKPNAAEAAIIAGLSPDAELSNTIASLTAHSNFPLELYISMGEGGIAVAHGEALELIAMCPKSLRPGLVNRSGAGDAACATLVWLSVAARQARAPTPAPYAPSPSVAAGQATASSSAPQPPHIIVPTPREKAQFAIAGALFAAAAEGPVNPRLTIQNLCEIARTCYPELARLTDAIRNGGSP